MENQISPITVSGGRPTHFQALFSAFPTIWNCTISYNIWFGNLSDNQWIVTPQLKVPTGWPLGQGRDAGEIEIQTGRERESCMPSALFPSTCFLYEYDNLTFPSFPSCSPINLLLTVLGPKASPEEAEASSTSPMPTVSCWQGACQDIAPGNLLCLYLNSHSQFHGVQTQTWKTPGGHHKFSVRFVLTGALKYQIGSSLTKQQVDTLSWWRMSKVNFHQIVLINFAFDKRRKKKL